MVGLFEMSALRRWTLFFYMIDGMFLVAGILVTIVSFMWKSLIANPPQANEDIFLRLSVSNSILNAGIIFGVAVFVTVTVSIWPLSSKTTREDAGTDGFVWFLVVLINTTVLTVGIGTSIWLSTLTEKAHFLPIWSAQTTDIQVFIQNTLQCCGWFNATSDGLFNSGLQTGFCSDPASLPVNPDPNVRIGCQQPFVKKADFILNNIFTNIYGFAVIQFTLILIAATVYQLRLQEKRLLRIEYKTSGGKGGFV